MQNQGDYDDYSDDEDSDDLHAECLHCGTLNRFPGKDIPKILAMSVGKSLKLQAT